MKVIERSKSGTAQRLSSQSRFGLILMLPTLIAVFGIVLVPLAKSLWLSFHRHDLARPQLDAFVGLDNYDRLLHNAHRLVLKGPSRRKEEAAAKK
jgi:ABC-type sugar transport system permease subunit